MHKRQTPPVVTRFPPSPTGALHIGGARTALYNFLYAKKHKGRFLIRIEDTKHGQDSEKNAEAILEDLEWLGIHQDNKQIPWQSQSADRHRQVADALREAGKAYRCYDSVLHHSKQAAHNARAQDTAFRSPWRDKTWEAPEGKDFVVRLKVPRSGETTIRDVVQGEVSLPNEQIDDFVLLRSDGTPTYMLSVVVDDTDSDITHIVRGDDHFTNAFRQLCLYRACQEAEIFDPNKPSPQYAHIPMVLDEEGKKLSKRAQARSIGSFREEGFLPEALLNYLLRLGWGHETKEIFSLEEASQAFQLEDLGSAPSRFDLVRLRSLNARYLRAMPIENLRKRVERFLPEGLSDEPRTRFLHGIEGLRKRAATLKELVELGAFYFCQPILPLQDAKAESVMEQARRHLPRFLPHLRHELDALSDAEWQADNIKAVLRMSAEKSQLGFGAVARPVRALCAGRMDSPDLAEILDALGKREAIARLSRASV